MSEATFQRKCIELANQAGVAAWAVQARGRRGFPDLLLIFQGGAVAFVELKVPGGRLSVLQERTINVMKKLGAHIYVCFTIEEFDAVIRRHLPGPTGGHLPPDDG